MLFKTTIGAVVFLLALNGHATCPSTPTAARYKLNGAEVTDFKTGLIWSRCVVGETLNGNSCSGVAQGMTHEQALVFAQAASGWRLPNAKELFSIVDHGCDLATAVDATAFPTGSESQLWLWSSTRSGGADSAMYVAFGGALSVNESERSRILNVRLVRDSQ